MDGLAKEIPYSIKTADSFMKRLKGLMFRKNPIENEGLWITPCNSIHMFFMNFPLDIVFLNEQNEVVKLHPGLKPWRMTIPLNSAHSVIELPEGSINKLEINVGDILYF
jgi:uncharacterized protein